MAQRSPPALSQSVAIAPGAKCWSSQAPEGSGGERHPLLHCRLVHGKCGTLAPLYRVFT